jgi:hypothetical protein
LSSVVFPAPLSPINAVMVPGRTNPETSFRSFRFPPFTGTSYDTFSQMKGLVGGSLRWVEADIWGWICFSADVSAGLAPSTPCAPFAPMTPLVPLTPLEPLAILGTLALLELSPPLASLASLASLFGFRTESRSAEVEAFGSVPRL